MYGWEVRECRDIGVDGSRADAEVNPRVGRGWVAWQCGLVFRKLCVQRVLAVGELVGVRSFHDVPAERDGQVSGGGCARDPVDSYGGQGDVGCRPLQEVRGPDSGLGVHVADPAARRVRDPDRIDVERSPEPLRSDSGDGHVHGSLCRGKACRARRCNGRA